MRTLARLLVLTTALTTSTSLVHAQAHKRGGSAAPAAHTNDPPPADTTQADDPKKEEARGHFQRGLTLFNEQTYDAALAEFRKSLELFPTRAAAQNIAVALKRLKRFDESADAFDKLLEDFPTISPQDRAFVEGERKDLLALIGTLEVRGSEADSTIIIDGVERGKTPLAKPLRVSSGSHLLRVVKEGFLPFERQIEVAGKSNLVVEAKLGALLRGGRLRVTEDGGGSVDVLVDNVVVGKTPYEGTLPVGKHTVVLRGEGSLGSPPASVDIQLNQLSKLSLVVEPLLCSIRVEPTPITALVAIDGVDVGQGTWEGAVRCGGHQVEIAAEGFLPATRTLALTEGKPGKVIETLERDQNSELWKAQNPSRITLDLRAGVALSPGVGGEAANRCGDGCGSGMGLGGLAQLRLGYQLGSGIGFAADAGFLYLRQRYTGRASEVIPQGLAEQQGTLTESMFLRGPLLGGSVSIQKGQKLVFMGRLGAGVFLSAWKDVRDGVFSTPNGTQYTVPSTPGTVLSESGVVVTPYINPEVRLGYRLNKTFIVDVGFQGFAFFGMQSARWQNEAKFYAGRQDCTTVDADTCSGRASFRQDRLFSGTILAFVPFVGGRAEF